MTEFFKTRIQNLEKSIQPIVLLRNSKISNKGKPQLLITKRTMTQIKNIRAKTFARFMGRVDILWMSEQFQMYSIGKLSKKRQTDKQRKTSTPSME